jgi:hypothetical protein
MSTKELILELMQIALTKFCNQCSTRDHFPVLLSKRHPSEIFKDRTAKYGPILQGKIASQIGALIYSLPASSSTFCFLKPARISNRSLAIDHYIFGHYPFWNFALMIQEMVEERKPSYQPLSSLLNTYAYDSC